LTGFITTSLFALLVFTVIGRRTGGWTARKGAAGAAVVLLGLLATSNDPARPLTWLLSGLVIGVALLAGWVLVLRFDLAALPAAMAAATILAQVRLAVVGAFPGARLGAAVAIVLLALAGVAATAWLRPRRDLEPPSGEAPQSAAA
jgi:hypothetical protein